MERCVSPLVDEDSALVVPKPHSAALPVYLMKERTRFRDKRLARAFAFNGSVSHSQLLGPSHFLRRQTWIGR